MLGDMILKAQEDLRRCEKLKEVGIVIIPPKEIIHTDNYTYLGEKTYFEEPIKARQLFVVVIVSNGQVEFKEFKQYDIDENQSKLLFDDCSFEYARECFKNCVQFKEEYKWK